MIVRAVSFNPLRYEVNGIEIPVVENIYLDEDNKSQSIKYVIMGGEKVVIQMKEEILEKVFAEGIDKALIKVEEDRKTKEEEKNKPK